MLRKSFTERGDMTSQELDYDFIISCFSKIGLVLVALFIFILGYNYGLRVGRDQAVVKVR